MAITEIGNSIQIRIKFESGEYLKSQKKEPTEPWNEVLERVLKEHKALKKSGQ